MSHEPPDHFADAKDEIINRLQSSLATSAKLNDELRDQLNEAKRELAIMDERLIRLINDSSSEISRLRAMVSGM